MPMTEALFKACEVGIQQAKEAWLHASLDGGVSDAVSLAKVRERIAVFQEIRNMTAEKLSEAVNG